MAQLLYNPRVPLIEGALDFDWLDLSAVAGTGNGCKVPICGYRHIMFVISNTAALSYDVTFKASPSGTGGTKGDLVVPVAATNGRRVVILDTSLHQQDSQEVHIEIPTGMTGEMLALAMV